MLPTLHSEPAFPHKSSVDFRCFYWCNFSIFTNKFFCSFPFTQKKKISTTQQLKNCNTKPKPHTDEQWEKDLEAELQDFEVVADGAERSTTNWEKDVDELLEDDDETDLK